MPACIRAPLGCTGVLVSSVCTCFVCVRVWCYVLVWWSQVRAHGWFNHASFPVSGNTQRKYSCEGREELWNGDWLLYSGLLCLSLDIQVQHGPCTVMSPAPSVSSLLLWASGFQEAPEPLFVTFPDLVYFPEAEAWA